MEQWEEWISSADGTGLYARAAVPNEPKGTVVIVHGLCEHQGRYDYVAKRLLDAGYAVWRFDLRGHGRSGGKRVFYAGYAQMVEDLEAVVKRVGEESRGTGLAGRHFGGKPLFLLGHSMGGLASVLYATKHPQGADGVVLTGARTRFNHSDWGKVLPFDETEETYHEAGFGAGICTDLHVVEEYRRDPLVEKRYTAGIRNSCWYGVLWQQEHAGEFTAPVLILHGAEDPIVSCKESRDFYREIGSEDKTIRIYDGLYHEILNEPCRAEILDGVIGWLDGHCQAGGRAWLDRPRDGSANPLQSGTRCIM